MNETIRSWHGVDRDKMAALLSIVPGLGHLYKHHYFSGFGILIGGNILVGFVSVLMMLGTFGLSLLLIPAYIAGMAAAAHKLPDWHGRHHYLHPWTPVEKQADDDGPQV